MRLQSSCRQPLLVTQSDESTAAIRKGSQAELQQLPNSAGCEIDQIDQITMEQGSCWILHQCKEAAGLEEASLCER